MIEEAAESLAETLYENEGVPVTYTRVGETPLPITIVRARMRAERNALADGRVNLEVEPQDFLIRPEVLDFGAGPVEPQLGDRITDEGRWYELSPRDGERCWIPQYGWAMYRLRTIRIQEPDARAIATTEGRRSEG